MSRATSYLALMVIIYPLYYGGKMIFQAIAGTADKPVESFLTGLIFFILVGMYYFFIYRPFKGK